MHSVLKTVATFEYAHFAHLAKTKLESEEIECFIFDEQTSSIVWFYTNAIGGIKLKVRAEDFERAKEILQDNANSVNEETEIVRNESDLIPENDSLICPGCGSDKIKDEKISKKFAYLSILFLGFPLLFRKKKYECTNCGFMWDKN